jgi:hypothetical protein
LFKNKDIYLKRYLYDLLPDGCFLMEEYKMGRQPGQDEKDGIEKNS